MKNTTLTKNKHTIQKNKKGAAMHNPPQSTHDVENVTISDILGISSWNRQRSSDELQDFVSRKHEPLSDQEEDVNLVFS